MPDFDAKYEALRSRLEESLGLQVYRRDLTSDDLTGKQPAVVLRVLGLSPENEEGCAPVWTLGAQVGLYARNAAKDGQTDALLLDLISQVVGALEIQPGEASDFGQHTTLGGVVARAWVSGEVEFLPGELTDQAVAFVPIELLVYGGSN